MKEEPREFASDYEWEWRAKGGVLILARVTGRMELPSPEMGEPAVHQVQGE